ncbi:alpha-1,2-fucosyltransferase [Sphingomonas sp. Leaf339]|uniref:alpha-1,2-fucosyltransferase n=1 Tax=Sphingomonas sp. Leaf339 TaxID=1736343 RepID=UPI0012E3AA69|nr:alpha-1,2-fucosyltransferase [Sphingomonas sp. Leaf339]
MLTSDYRKKSPMIVSQLTGGLGNQLFQYATGYAAAARAQDSFEIDVRHYDVVDPNFPSRPFALGHLAITAPRISSFTAKRIGLSKRLRLMPGRFDILVDQAEGFDPRVPAITDNTYLIGCWQSELFFADHRSRLLDEFAFRTAPDEKNAELLAAIKAQPSVCVHFRRTDYLGPSTTLRACPPDYYDRALSAMEESVPGVRYFVFTDDPEWVSRNARLPDNSTLVSHNVGSADIEDFRLMSNCRHFITANSSFSWWAAWLADHRDKQVIAPAVWYESGHGSEGDLVPQQWRRM